MLVGGAAVATASAGVVAAAVLASDTEGRIETTVVEDTVETVILDDAAAAGDVNLETSGDVIITEPVETSEVSIAVEGGALDVSNQMQTSSIAVESTTVESSSSLVLESSQQQIFAGSAVEMSVAGAGEPPSEPASPRSEYDEDDAFPDPTPGGLLL